MSKLRRCRNHHVQVTERGGGKRLSRSRHRWGLVGPRYVRVGGQEVKHLRHQNDM